MRVWKVNQKKKKKEKKDNYENTTNMKMENEGIFQVFPKISNLSPGTE